ncbi:MAG: polyphosphate kinase 2 family protein [Myxococcales bacterium]|nr:polyphosphate kinase 2 family protein [Myxococcales bacterium]MCB9668648.1 polyphosphate kinase 2 family protein [Alphaproteobacteria bacterium]MCB9690887.1 polyphosphate kinase 2 family protein [Alphaproteobacteria bacterium]
MYQAAASPWLVPFDGTFSMDHAPTTMPDRPSKKEARRDLAERVEEIAELQRVMYAHDHHSVLCVFQAMDAAGKDSTVRHVFSGVNPAGCQVFAFKQPSSTELDHDFLWRTTCRNPERGRIGVFNRSYYEEVLVVRVHPSFLDGQRLPHRKEGEAPGKAFWEGRYASIRDHEAHLARSGTLVLKFFLNVSRDEQRERFLARIEDRSKNWKFSRHDLSERALWPKYMEAYEDALNATSRPWAPWYAIPADDKSAMQLAVATILAENLKALDMRYPRLHTAALDELEACRQRLLAED